MEGRQCDPTQRTKQWFPLPMGVFTLDASNIKGIARKFVCLHPVWNGPHLQEAVQNQSLQPKCFFHCSFSDCLPQITSADDMTVLTDGNASSCIVLEKQESYEFTTFGTLNDTHGCRSTSNTLQLEITTTPGTSCDSLRNLFFIGVERDGSCVNTQGFTRCGAKNGSANPNSCRLTCGCNSGCLATIGLSLLNNFQSLFLCDAFIV